MEKQASSCPVLHPMEYWVHLDYEVEHFAFAVTKAIKPVESPPIDPRDRNLFLECALLHARGLLDFLRNDSGERKKPDDICPQDFAAGFQRRRILADMHERMHKELAHLTYARKRDDDPTKGWDLALLAKELLGCLAELYRSVQKSLPGTAVSLLDELGQPTSSVWRTALATTSATTGTIKVLGSQTTGEPIGQSWSARIPPSDAD